MAKILIAGIGGGKNKETGKYNTINYSFNDKEYKDRTFITSALEEHFCIDKTIYFGTVGSMWDNLYEYYCKKYNIDCDENYLLYLLENIEKANKNIDISTFDIDTFNRIFNEKVKAKLTFYGTDEKEIFNNFNIIMDLKEELNSGDEVYIDITHSFRSNAMWMFLVMNFISDVIDKDIKIKAITYGMFEIKDKNTNTAPILELNAFYKLLKWIKGAETFKNYGNIYPISDYIENKETKKKLETFSNSMNLNHIGSLKQNISSLKRVMPLLDNMQGPGKILIPDIVKNFIKDFDEIEEDYLLQVKLARWHYSHKRYALVYLNLNEAIIRFIFEELKEYFPSPVEYPKLKDYTPEERENEELKFAKHWINSLKPYFEGKNQRKINISENKAIKLKEYYKVYQQCRKIRNKIAHSSEGKDNALTYIINLSGLCDKIEKLLSDKNFIYNCELELNLSEKIKKRLIKQD